jgi:2-amino-4-hydroxy-6-hydroxymethyldihydropteridine diphosphokinase
MDLLPPQPAPETDAFVALGSNLGDRAAGLRAAVRGLDAHPHVRVTATSPVYESAAHTLRPDEAQPSYLNAVVRLRTTLAPEALMAALLRLERLAGRDRSAARRWAARTLDLDLLLFGDLTCKTPALTVPHPRLGARRFVLRPLADLAPNLRVPPPYDTTVRALLARCPDPHALSSTNLRLRPHADV